MGGGEDVAGTGSAGWPGGGWADEAGSGGAGAVAGCKGAGGAADGGGCASACPNASPPPNSHEAPSRAKPTEPIPLRRTRAAGASLSTRRRYTVPRAV
jgi:hypothetical protein